MSLLKITWKIEEKAPMNTITSITIRFFLVALSLHQALFAEDSWADPLKHFYPHLMEYNGRVIGDEDLKLRDSIIAEVTKKLTILAENIQKDGITEIVVMADDDFTVQVDIHFTNKSVDYISIGKKLTGDEDFDRLRDITYPYIIENYKNVWQRVVLLECFTIKENNSELARATCEYRLFKFRKKETEKYLYVIIYRDFLYLICAKNDTPVNAMFPGETHYPIEEN